MLEYVSEFENQFYWTNLWQGQQDLGFISIYWTNLQREQWDLGFIAIFGIFRKKYNAKTPARNF